MVAPARRLVAFLKAEDGPTAVEYAVMLALIIVVCIAVIATVGDGSKGTFGETGASMEATAAAGE